MQPGMGNVSVRGIQPVLVIAFGFDQIIGSEFLKKAITEHDSRHGLAYNGERRDDAVVSSLHHRLAGLFGLNIDCLQRLIQGRDRLAHCSEYDVLSIRHSSLQTTGVV